MHALALVAAVLVVGSGPPPVSAEVTDRLDFRGRWEGTVTVCRGETGPVTVAGGMIDLGRGLTAPCTFTDAGRGRVVMRLDGDVWRGTYRVEQGRIVLRFGRGPGTMRFALWPARGSRQP